MKANVLLQEAQWAIKTYRQSSRTQAEQFQQIAAAHRQASLTPASGRDRRVHELLMNNPMPTLQSVYQEIFEQILGQRVSKAGPRLVQAGKRLELAKQTGKPILFILHSPDAWSNPSFSAITHQLINEYVVIVMPLREAPALSQLTEQPPFEASGSGRPLFVVARSDCQQLESVAGWHEGKVAAALARGWANALERKPPSVRNLVRAQRLMRKADPASADRVRELTIRVQEEKRKARENVNRQTTELVAVN